MPTSAHPVQAFMIGTGLIRALPPLAKAVRVIVGALPLPPAIKLRLLLMTGRFRVNNQRYRKDLRRFSREDIGRAFARDPWLENFFLNLWEFEKGLAVLESYPWDICFPIADVCNARCSFCTSWLEGTKVLELDELDRFEPVIRHAALIGLAGHGEPLSHPQFPEILKRIDDWSDPRARAYVISNGVFLEDHLEALLNSRVYSIAISLNAASAETHETVMGLEQGAFDKVIKSIQRLTTIRDSGVYDLAITISLVVTQQNVHELAAFVDLGNRLKVDQIQVKTLAGADGSIQGLNYHLLPPYLHPEFAAHADAAMTAIARSDVEIIADSDSWSTPVFPESVLERFKEKPPEELSRAEARTSTDIRAYYAAQEKYQHRTRGAFIERIDDRQSSTPAGRTPRFSCQAPYHNLYVNDFAFSMVPCCYMNTVPGHEPVSFDGSYDFFEAWNSPAMKHLRTRLEEGPLFDMCHRCPGVY